MRLLATSRTATFIANSHLQEIYKLPDEHDFQNWEKDAENVHMQEENIQILHRMGPIKPGAFLFWCNSANQSTTGQHYTDINDIIIKAAKEFPKPANPKERHVLLHIAFIYKTKVPCDQFLLIYPPYSLKMMKKAGNEF